MIELTLARMGRFQEQYGLSAYGAEVLNLSRDTAEFYEVAVAAARDADAKLIANWTMAELLALQKDDRTVEPAQLAALVDLVAKKTISGAVAKELLVRIADEGIDPSRRRGCGGARSGELGFFVGQVMKATQGKADPGATKDLIVELLAER